MAGALPGIWIEVMAIPEPRESSSNELDLCKAALLYGDRVTLYSRDVIIAKDLKWLEDSDEQWMCGVLRAFSNASPSLKLLATLKIDAFEQLCDIAHPTKQEEMAVLSLRARLRHAWMRLQEEVNAYVEEARSDLLPAIDCGLLEIDSLEKSRMFDPNMIMHALHIMESRRSYPLFDAATVRQMRNVTITNLHGEVRYGPQTPAVTITHLRQTQALVRMVEMLPGFPRATVSEIVDIRNDLKEPLSRFRKALVELTDNMQADAHDDAFDAELLDLYTARVAPAIQEIRELIQESRYLRELGKQVTNAGSGLATAGLTVAAKGAHAPDLLAFVLAGAVPAIRAAWERNEAMRSIRKQPFYFLYGVERRLT